MNVSGNTGRWIRGFWCCLMLFKVASAAPAQTDEWFRSEEGRRAIENVLGWQAPKGGWPKNSGTSTKPFAGDAKKLKRTFDNGTTTTEWRLLARA